MARQLWRVNYGASIMARQLWRVNYGASILAQGISQQWSKYKFENGARHNETINNPRSKDHYVLLCEQRL